MLSSFQEKSGFYLSLIKAYSYSNYKLYFQSLKAAFKECLVSLLTYMGIRKTTGSKLYQIDTHVNLELLHNRLYNSFLSFQKHKRNINKAC